MIVLLNPPSPPWGVSNKDTMGGLGQLYPPTSPIRMPTLDLLYAASVLRARRSGDAVSVMDGLLDPAAVDRPTAARLVLLRTSAPTFEWDLGVARAVKQRTGAKVYAFGPYVWQEAERVLAEPALDGLLNGEPETLVEALADGRDAPGIMRRGSPIMRGPIVSDLDALPFPAWDLVDARAYDLGEAADFQRPVVTMLASRGCPFTCNYCPYPETQGNKWRKRSPASVAAELAHVVKSLGVRFVLFRDPEFTLDRRRTIAIAQEILKSRVNVCWRAETRIDMLDEEQLVAMRDAGCVALNLGVETMDSAVLEAVKRTPIAEDKMAEVLGACRKLGIRTTCFFVIGLPGETRDGVLRMIEAARELDPDHVQFTVATPYPGTGLAAWAAERGFAAGTKPSGLTSYAPSMHNEHLAPPEIQALCDLAKLSWRLHRDARSGAVGLLRYLYRRFVKLPYVRRRVSSRSVA